MFDKVVNSLLSGAVICPYTNRDAYDFLSQEGRLDEVNSYVGRIGKRVASPANGGAHFLVHADAAATTKAEVRRLHKEVLGEVRPVLGFMDLCMSALRTDAVLRAGDPIPSSQIVAAIDADNKLRSDLQELMSLLRRSTGNTNRERFDCVLGRLREWGYIDIVDTDREIYQATGRIELFHDLVAFFIEYTPDAQEFVDGQNEQESLF